MARKYLQTTGKGAEGIYCRFRLEGLKDAESDRFLSTEERLERVDQWAK